MKGPLVQKFIVPSTKCICVFEGHPFGCFKKWCSPDCEACREFYVNDPERLMLPELGTFPREDDAIPPAVLARSKAAFQLLCRSEVGLVSFASGVVIGAFVTYVVAKLMFLWALAPLAKDAKWLRDEVRDFKKAGKR